ncbi:MAG: hypothetical protein IPJ13_11335 [Saprospiraceae bacterium]|nr:hypothetical protein [Saprospiraceae bacterium]
MRDFSLNDIIISRLKHSGSSEVFSPPMDTRLSDKDVMMVVGTADMVEKFIDIIGKESSDQLIEDEKDVVSKTIFVTKKSASHKTKKLLEPDFLSLFGGLVIGIIIGSIPIAIPSLPVPIKLGFAAGPLLAALMISRYGGIGVIHSYINNGAIHFMKDLGICLFFASVGLHAGTHFYENFTQNNGWLWIFYGAFITFVPLIFMVFVGKVIMKINYAKLIGLMSGSYTDPAALAFSNGYIDSDVPTQSYATVYPLVTIFRIFVAQILILLCF